jgi:hypothetical protein
MKECKQLLNWTSFPDTPESRFLLIFCTQFVMLILNWVLHVVHR